MVVVFLGGELGFGMGAPGGVATFLLMERVHILEK